MGQLRKLAYASSGALQDEIWKRKYGFSWGTRDEWTQLLVDHPELLALSVKRAADEILTNLSVWAPQLEAKQVRAKAAYIDLTSPQE